MVNSESESGFSFEEQARLLAEKSPISGNDGHMLLDYYGLSKQDVYNGIWENLKDKKILDVCAGVSDFTARLLNRGADAYALDLGYSNPSSHLLRARSLSPKKFVSVPFYIPMPPLNKTFIDSLHKNPERYVAGSAHAMPFEAESFDAVVSSFGIFGVIDKDFDLLKMSVDEMIRIVRPDGIIMIGPLMPKRSDITDQEKANQARLVHELDQRTDVYIIPRYPTRGKRPLDDLGQLVIQKVDIIN